ncbi:MAG: hypothetical protein GFH27_549279n259 [Chloroflexi bacterium AL-W]|nr:hypothetical protein [Chloroflexi bacterium AL-N1]NOK65225.1 hypothetical protein [Chloroflexi bacterium AL-N10]NOK72510.1 hypothetical protein [Chloroflexi bacterium AL-N5]NOK79404.1 hypothetical protein [Chloroflexi bacterium AL-W]NOK87320.1 hypothetical protein [Chloroflexi bacterium AL-N15]
MGEKKQLSRRQMLLLSGKASLAVAVLAACGQSPQSESQSSTGDESASTGDDAAPGQATGEIEFLAWGDQADLPAWDALTQQFAEVNPNLTVNVSSVAEPNQNFYPKLQTSIAGGTPPDISSFQGWEWQTYADRDLLAPVADLAERDGLMAMYDNSIASVEGSTMRNGVTFLVPLQIATMLMLYAKKPFDDAGIPYPTDDWTFEQFVEIAQQLTNTDGDAKRYGYQANGQWFRDIHWIRSTGAQEFDQLIDPTQVIFNQPEIVEMVQMIAQDFIHTLNISPLQADIDTGASTIETGGSAMKYEGPWFLARLNNPELREQGKQVDFDVVLMPQGTDTERPHRGWAEGVALLNGDNVEAAWSFASFMAGEEGQKTYSEITGRMPNSLTMVESFWLPKIGELFQVQNGQAFIEAFRRSEVDVIGKVPRSQMWSEVVKPNGWDPLLNNSATAAEVLPAVDEALQRLIDESST